MFHYALNNSFSVCKCKIRKFYCDWRLQHLLRLRLAGRRVEDLKSSNGGSSDSPGNAIMLEEFVFTRTVCRVQVQGPFVHKQFYQVSREFKKDDDGEGT